jgi:hypothetical protein
LWRKRKTAEVRPHRLPQKAQKGLEMKLLSFAADGKELFGAVSGEGVITLNDKIGQPDLRTALATGAMEAMRKAANAN